MSSWTDGASLMPRLRVKKRNRILDKKNLCLQARALSLYIKFRQPVKEKILYEGTRQKDK